MKRPAYGLLVGVAGPLALDCRERDWLAKAKLEELTARQLGASILDLVGAEDYGLAAASEQLDDLCVSFGWAGLGIEQEHDDVGFAHRLLGLAHNLW